MKQSNSKTKKRKISKRKFCRVDVISNLPDSILSHILSFLPSTQEAVATSILSKRWRYVWTCVDKLKFHDSKWLDKVLKLHQGNIKDFTLHYCHAGRDKLNVISLINTVMSRGVERLCLDDINYNHWPLSFFTCKTLVDLWMPSLDGNNVDFPGTPIFPCLKKLQVMYSDGEFLKPIVSRCSALEDLGVSLHGTQFDIVSSSMKRLNIRLRSDSIFNKKVVLRVPSLQYLKFYCALPFQFIVEDRLSSLTEADISIHDLGSSGNENSKLVQDSFGRFIQHLSNVKVLLIDSNCDTFFNSVGHGLFRNLTKLDIVSNFFEWRMLLSFMENSINLEAISLTKMLKEHKLGWREPKIVPTSLSSSLKKISIHGYIEGALPMVTYVLSTAQILEQVDIHCEVRYTNDVDNTLRNLQKVHTASERCKKFLVYD